MKHKLSTNIQIVNKEGKFGRVSDYELWSWNDTYQLFNKEISSNEYELILKKYHNMMSAFKICFPKHQRVFAYSDFPDKFLNDYDKDKINNTINVFYIYKLSMFTDNYVREYPDKLKSFSDEEIGLLALENFKETSGYEDFLYLKKWLSENRNIKKLNPNYLDKIIKNWKECDFITPSKIDIFMENYAYAIFDAKRNGYVSRSNQCGILANAMIFENEKKAKSFSKTKKIAENSYIIKIKMEVDSVSVSGENVDNYSNDLKEALSHKEKKKMLNIIPESNLSKNISNKKRL